MMEKEPTVFWQMDGDWYAILVTSEGKYESVQLEKGDFERLQTKFDLVDDPSITLSSGHVFVLKPKP